MITWRRGRGFTVVELVVVIILLSILSATALSRFSRPDVFAASALANTLTAQIHFAAQAAQTRSTPVTLNVTQAGGRLFMQVASAGVMIRETQAALKNVSLSLDNNGTEYTVSEGDIWQMTFLGKGDLVAASLDADVLDPESGVTVLFSGDNDRLLCVQPIGYVSEQAC
ncbi:MAG: prepilin-type N-terminal cleavage/methylation domain-containing protein [Pseudomonadaceae bacterium]|nr:prepilin-type N-terminal cleavage/methylation domain-containing protein [Pseudomonadaceae bacterium]